MKRLGRFTKAEILEAEARFLEGQSLYRIGRNMKRSQASIKSHLINLGFIDYEPVEIYEELSWPLNNSVNWIDLMVLSLLFIVLPSTGLVYIGYLLLKTF